MPQMSKVSRNNTAVLKEDGKISVVLHSTRIVSFDDKTITLNNGGWITTTTCARMNQASNEYGLGYSVSRQSGQMQVSFKGKTHYFGDSMTFTLKR
jgi:hypothetical protein